MQKSKMLDMVGSYVESLRLAERSPATVAQYRREILSFLAWAEREDITKETVIEYKSIRRLIYTTNAIEGFNRQLRKVTKSRAVFPTDDSLFIYIL